MGVDIRNRGEFQKEEEEGCLLLHIKGKRGEESEGVIENLEQKK